MRSLKYIAAPLAAFALPFTHGIRIIQTNDDGWAEGNLRVLNDALNAMGHQVVLSAPAENQSGRANSGPVGSNATRPDLNWVNSFPATSARYGIDSIGPKLWSGAKPELVVTGPNVGANLWLVDWVSGTVGAACYAAHDAGIPAIAFSGANTDTHPWNTPASLESAVFAEISANITQSIIDAGKPYLPKDVFLNVNMPKIVAGGSCSKASDVKYVLSRITSGIFSAPDVNWCGGSRLPSELHVHQSTPCSVSISVGDASDKTTADADAQQKVLDKLKPLLSCL
ncbi:Acid phosphatase [Metarhizium anisopliae]|nr:Acid phosphatase [Metarhizium anisopliae]